MMLAFRRRHDAPAGPVTPLVVLSQSNTTTQQRATKNRRASGGIYLAAAAAAAAAAANTYAASARHSIRPAVPRARPENLALLAPPSGNTRENNINFVLAILYYRIPRSSISLLRLLVNAES